MKRSLALFSLLALCAVSVSSLAQGQPGSPPFAGKKSMTCEEALKQAPKDDAELAPLAKSLATCEVKYKKSPKNAAAQKEYVDAAFKYGDALMHLPQGKLTPP